METSEVYGSNDEKVPSATLKVQSYRKNVKITSIVVGPFKVYKLIRIYQSQTFRSEKTCLLFTQSSI